MTVEELATLLHIPKKTIYQRWRDWQLPALKIGRYLRFSRSAVNDWLQNQMPSIEEHGKRAPGRARYR